MDGNGGYGMLRRISLIAAGLLLAIDLFGADEYKKYDRPQSEDYFMKIAFIKRQLIMTINGEDTTETMVFTRGDVRKTAQEVFINNNLFVDSAGFHLAGKVYPADIIDRVEVETTPQGETKLLFFKKGIETARPYRSHKKNVISLLKDINIGSEEFIRGAVVSFWSDIRVDGEVNEEVVAVFGTINIGDNAVIRGNVATVGGSVSIAKKATIYGAIQSADTKNKFDFGQWRRWYRHDRTFSPMFSFNYNRVDGAAPLLGVQFRDEDSVLPEIKVYAGYAFASDRWRYHIGIEQTFFEKYPFTFGGSYYRKLASNDDLLISETENTIFALLATEDNKDYFEAEGGYGFARIKLFGKISYELGVLAEKYKWLNGHRNLWSLGGGSKRFSENFLSLEGPERALGQGEIEGRDITSLMQKIRLDTRKDEGLFEGSFWEGAAEIEWAPDKWNSDFVFSRYMFVVSRHQSLGMQSGLLLRGAYGGSDGYLPLQRKFFIGGLGTLYGYKQKEYMGTEFWLGDIEYGIEFPNSGMIGWLFYNVGQIGDGPGRLAEAEVKHALGVGLSFEEDIRINVSKRMDRSEASPKFYVRLEHLF